MLVLVMLLHVLDMSTRARAVELRSADLLSGKGPCREEDQSGRDGKSETMLHYGFL